MDNFLFEDRAKPNSGTRVLLYKKYVCIIMIMIKRPKRYLIINVRKILLYSLAWGQMASGKSPHLYI